MGRELKRVPLDFDWPLNKVWEGYLQPDYRPCPSDDCDSGYILAARWLECIAHLLLLAGESSVSDRPLHPWLQAVPLAPDRRPGPQLADLTGRLAGRSPHRLGGHDALDRWSATAAIVEAAGLPKDWGTCPACNGHAIHPDDLEASEAWESTEPPTGEGYQLWETTTEGSPQTPVFETLDALCEYAAAHVSTFADYMASKEEWKRMLEEDFVGVELESEDGATRIMLL